MRNTSFTEFWSAQWSSFYSGTPSKTMSILVVEDDVFLKPLIRQLISSVAPGAEIHWSTGVSDARKLLRKKKFDLIIADCLLGGDSGLVLWDYCKEKHPKIHMLMMSGLSAKTFEKLVGEKRALPPFVQKPFNIRECQGMIADLLEPLPTGGRA